MSDAGGGTGAAVADLDDSDEDVPAIDIGNQADNSWLKHEAEQLKSFAVLHDFMGGVTDKDKAATRRKLEKAMKDLKAWGHCPWILVYLGHRSDHCVCAFNFNTH